ncbi:DNA repair protein RecN [Thermaurantimonas aggregans]|uniref:DNA repair protein RecN n=1 Tax=Thermaurantimonas aggregans TaxID=2173829 RepID=A0A401XJ89_9FLAO|nr:DNA repair protein RecN [Thermaurantimonas aggregans]GCD77070.1 DNA repair protein RecN [Thermaurantimonas aggregans]
MIRHLKIQNLALIDRLSIDFQSGLTILTGETGAGKSVILSAFSLLSGSRASADIAGNPDQKCIVEAVFDIQPYGLESFFAENDLDYDHHLIIRRELLPGGKSRAFVQDSPVNLQTLKELAGFLIDIHSQHDTLLLTQQSYLLRLLDRFADNDAHINSYHSAYQRYKKLLADKEELLRTEGTDRDIDYKKFLLQELESAKIKPDELRKLEQEIQLAENAEDTLNRLQLISSLIYEDEVGILSQFRRVEADLRHLARLSPTYENLYQRWEALVPEIKDIATTLDDQAATADLDPAHLEQLRQRFDLLMHLCNKHRTHDSDQLLDLQKQFEAEIHAFESHQSYRQELDALIAQAEEQLHQAAQALTQSREAVIPALEREISELLKQLNFASAQFAIQLSAAPYSTAGTDAVDMLFSPNPGMPMAPVRQIASGGELSRLMLAIKSVLARKKSLPTILFDEIDTGVSGASAEKIAHLLRALGSDIQVIAITHLPQIAAAAHHHYLVYKGDVNGRFQTNLKKLSDEEHLQEVARLLSGSTITDSALLNAKSIIQSYR